MAKYKTVMRNPVLDCVFVSFLRCTNLQNSRMDFEELKDAENAIVNVAETGCFRFFCVMESAYISEMTTSAK